MFVIEGALEVGEAGGKLDQRRFGLLGPGSRIWARAGADGARFLLVSGRPLNEPVARGGPFGMNTREAVLQAFDDYQHNRF